MKKTLKKVIVCLALIIVFGVSVYRAEVVEAQGYRGGESVFFSEEDLEFLDMARDELQGILKEKDIMALVYLVDRCALRQEAAEGSSEVVFVSGGQQVQVQDVVLDQNLESWVQVRCLVKGKEYTGFISRKYLACSDEKFLEWEMNYGMNPSAFLTMFTIEGENEAVSEPEKPVYEDVEMFPESYQDALYALKEQYPNWVFVKMNVDLEWDEVVTEELKNGRSLIHGKNPTAMKEGLYGQNWYYASEDAVAYYLDPRNRLSEDKIFQFELLTYNDSYHTEGALQSFLDNTFMKGKVPDTVLTYSFALTAIGKNFNISPFHLASRIYQEQGEGTSPLISGKYAGFEGYYNYYNIGATGSSNEEVIVNGLMYAKKQNWDSHYNSLHFGAEVIGSNYIAKGQDTLYLQKFDVDDSDGSLYWHQYMQNIGAPDSEGASIKKLYENAGALDNTFVFKIPVYKDMPEEACVKPETSNRVVLNILEDYTNLQVYMDGIPVTAVKKNGYYVAEAPASTVETAVMYQYDENNIPIGMAVWELNFDGSGYTAKEIEELRDALSYHGFSIRIKGRSGIRYKSGILQETKEKLINEGMEGYKLKEYGTLLMTKSKLGDGYLTFASEKVALGLSYGVGEDGKQVDKILEQVNGRDRFATVLVGLPVSEYETEFTFRTYMILTKGNQEIVLYGPQNGKSIYTLAKQVIDAKLYEEGSSADLFLKQLVSDADEYANLQYTQASEGNE